MARPSKSIGVHRGHLTEEEIQSRTETENRIKGSNEMLLPPDYLTEEQKRIFYYIKNNLIEADILGNLDLFILTQAAITIDRVAEAERDINDRGAIFLGKPNPNIKIKESYNKELFRICNELCLTPQARAKIAAINVKADTEKQDPLLKALEY